MADQITRITRTIQVYSPLPDDVLPNIMLRVEDRREFSRLACTCRGFYAWSEPWLKSRRQAAELDSDPQRLVKMPAWIKTHSRHLHPADCHAMQQWGTDGENRPLINALRRSVAFTEAASLVPGPAPSATECNAAHLDFILFSPRLLPDVNEDVYEKAQERLTSNAYFILTGFQPSGEAWEYDVLEGAMAWFKENAEKINIGARSRLRTDLMWAMQWTMIAERSPALAMRLLEHGLVKSHLVSVFDMGNTSEKRQEAPLLTALVAAAANSGLEAGSPQASAFLHAIQLVVSTLAQMRESAALSSLVGRLADVMAVMSERNWTPGSAEPAWLYTLVQAARNMPDLLANIRDSLIQQGFIKPGEWNAFLISAQSVSNE